MHRSDGEVPAADVSLRFAASVRQAHPAKRQGRAGLKIAISVITIVILFVLALMLTWSIQPPMFDIEERARQEVDAVDSGRSEPGIATVATAIGVGGTHGGRFFARADNLAEYLSLVEKRLGNFGVRLSSSIADANLRGMLPSSVAIGASPREAGVAYQAEQATPIDKVFFCARGYSWALLHFMRAISIDFAPILEGKNAEVAVQQIVRDLKGPVKPFYSPWVLNGSGYGFLANHSLVASSYIARVNAAVIELKILLQQG